MSKRKKNLVVDLSVTLKKPKHENERNLFILFCKKSQAFNTFLRTVLNPSSFAMLRLTCNSLKELLPRTKDPKIKLLRTAIVACSFGHFRLAKKLTNWSFPEAEEETPKEECYERIFTNTKNPEEMIAQQQYIKKWFLNTSAIFSFDYILNNCSQMKNLDLFKWLIDTNKKRWEEIEVSHLKMNSVFITAAEHGAIDILRYLPKRCIYLPFSILHAALAAKQFETVKYMCKTLIWVTFLLKNPDPELKMTICSTATTVHAPIEILDILAENSIDLYIVYLWGTFRSDYLDGFKWVATKEIVFDYTEWRRSIIHHDAVSIFKYLHTMGFFNHEILPLCYQRAIDSKSTKILRFMSEINVQIDLELVSKMEKEKISALSS